MDIGCGKGALLRNLVKQFAVEGFVMDIVSAKGHEYAFIKADAQNLPSRDGAFDIVYSLGVIEHRVRANLCGEQERRPKSIQDWQIKMLIGMLKDENLTPEFREFVAATLSDLAIENAASLVQYDSVKKLFEQIVAHPPSPDKDKIGVPLMSLLATSMPQVLADEKTRKWFFSNLYDSMLSKISDTKTEEKIREWAIKNVSKVVRLVNDPDRRSKAIDEFLEVYFETGSEQANTVRDELANLAPDFQKEILEKVKGQAQELDKRTKAEFLLKELISLWSANRMLKAVDSI